MARVMRIMPECVECTRAAGFDVVFTMSCWLADHTRLVIEMEE